MPNFFDGLLTGQQFLRNQQALQNGAIDLGFRDLDVANEFQFLGEFQNGGFQNLLASNNPYVQQRGFSNLFSQQAAQNQIAAQRASINLAQQLQDQLFGTAGSQRAASSALGGLSGFNTPLSPNAAIPDFGILSGLAQEARTPTVETDFLPFNPPSSSLGFGVTNLNGN